MTPLFPVLLGVIIFELVQIVSCDIVLCSLSLRSICPRMLKMAALTRAASHLACSSFRELSSMSTTKDHQGSGIYWGFLFVSLCRQAEHWSLSTSISRLLKTVIVHSRRPNDKHSVSPAMMETKQTIPSIGVVQGHWTRYDNVGTKLNHLQLQ